MDKIKDTIVLGEELENLREMLYKGIDKIITSKEEYENLLFISTKLDDVIVNYIKSSKK